MIYGDHDQKTLSQFNAVMKNADRGALMADGHVGYVMPIGGVAAYKNIIAPAGVGYDIACGNMAVMLDMKSEEIKDNLGNILDWIQENISFGIGRKNKEKVKSKSLAAHRAATNRSDSHGPHPLARNPGRRRYRPVKHHRGPHRQ